MRSIFVGVSSLALAVTACAQRGDPGEAAWPAAGWQRSSPEAQGMSSADLADALEFARSNDLDIHSLTIVRNGVVVLDAYFYPYTARMRHDVASVTKSIVSLLTGIAIGQGYLEGADQRVAPLLPDAPVSGFPEPAGGIRLENLLAMRSGFDCGFERGEPELAAMRDSRDWARFAMNLPMVAEPGTRYGYCSPNYHLLSAAISSVTETSVLDYARATLFAPLGIEDVYWPADSRGVNHGWGDLQLRPGDMARLGLLMLREGRWEDRQLVPRAWIEDSLTSRSAVSETEDYGLGWWLSTQIETLFEANGRGGQRISVVPGEELVVVMTGGGFEPGDIGGYIVRALRSESAIPEDEAGRERLAGMLRSVAAPPQTRPVTRSETSRTVSGKVYDLSDNALGIRSLALEFSDREALLRMETERGPDFVQPLALDGVYRLTEDVNGAVTAGLAEWLPDGRLRIDLNMLSRINRYTFEVEFLGDSVRITGSEATEAGSFEIRGTERRSPE